jgi:DNA-binding response OmpR family regulator
MEASPRRPRILIVDNNRDHTTGLSLLLKVSGCDVETALDGMEALAAAQARPPDMVVLEIRLPDMDGFQVAEHLRIGSDSQNTLIVALTGYDLEMVTGRTSRSVFDHFLVKPVDFKAILPLIRLAS